MIYRGHVKNGVVILEDEAVLPEGAEVRVEPVKQPGASATSLRGTPYRFEDPFTPAVGEEEWDSAR